MCRMMCEHWSSVPDQQEYDNNAPKTMKASAESAETVLDVQIAHWIIRWSVLICQPLLFTEIRPVEANPPSQAGRISVLALILYRAI